MFRLRSSYCLFVFLFAFTLTGCFGSSVSEPGFEITGVVNNESYEEPVTIVITPDKGTKITATLNDEVFESGTIITQSGNFTLVVVGELEKGKGQPKTETIEFSIDMQVPVITITGVEDKAYYGEAVTPVITTDSETDTVEVKLNDAAFTSGTTITEIGDYTLLVTATGENGKSYTITISFEIGVPLNHKFGISQELAGFSASKGSIAYDTEIVKEGGEAGSIRLTVADGNTYASLMIRKNSINNAHPDWITDWTPYDKISAWFYFEELDTIPENKGVVVRLDGNKTTQTMIPKSELKVGWNHIEADLESLMGGQIEKLANMDSVGFELIIDKKGSFIVDEIQLIKVM